MNRTTKMAAAVAALLTGVAMLGSQFLPKPVQAASVAEPVATAAPGVIIYGADESSSVVIPTATFAYIPTATPVIVPTATPTPVSPLPTPKPNERGVVFFSSVTDAGVDASPLTGRAQQGAIFESVGFDDVHLNTKQGAAGGLVRILNVSLHVKDPLRVGQRFPIVPDAYTVGARVLYTQARGSYNRVHSSQSGSVTVTAVNGNRIQVQLSNVRMNLNEWATLTGEKSNAFVLNGTLDVKNIPRLPRS